MDFLWTDQHKIEHFFVGQKWHMGVKFDLQIKMGKSLPHFIVIPIDTLCS